MESSDEETTEAAIVPSPLPTATYTSARPEPTRILPSRAGRAIGYSSRSGQAKTTTTEKNNASQNVIRCISKHQLKLWYLFHNLTLTSSHGSKTSHIIHTSSTTRKKLQKSPSNEKKTKNMITSTRTDQ